jgi:phytoene dehydrogenase-like protein
MEADKRPRRRRTRQQTIIFLTIALPRLLLLLLITGISYSPHTYTTGFLSVSPATTKPPINSRSYYVPNHVSFSRSSSSLHLFRKVFSRREDQQKTDPTKAIETDILVIGGGISGLVAAITAVNTTSTKNKRNKQLKVTVLEAAPQLGGRVKSITTEDGFTLDVGFAVFVENYPQSRNLFDYDALKLKPFVPGALVKLKGRPELARVSDPFRQPDQLLTALVSPIGSLLDKMKLIPLILNVRSKSIEQLFEEEETDSETALIERWKFSKSFVDAFYRPFLEGIYLCPLREQSSRMLSFVLKMFFEGVASLPEGGIGRVTEQLVKRASDVGVDFRMEVPATDIKVQGDGSILVKSEKNNISKSFLSKSVIVATDGATAPRLLSRLQGYEDLMDLAEQPHRAVGAAYYAFEGVPPVQEPILILNGMKGSKGIDESLVNNVCFPSAVNQGYCPDGFSICSVTILENAMNAYREKSVELDYAIRKELSDWFPEIKGEIMNKWELKRLFDVS